MIFYVIVVIFNLTLFYTFVFSKLLPYILLIMNNFQNQ